MDVALYNRAEALVLRLGRVSVSLLEQELDIGNSKAKALVEQLRTEGIIKAAGKKKLVVVDAGEQPATKPKKHGKPAPLAKKEPLPEPSANGDRSNRLMELLASLVDPERVAQMRNELQQRMDDLEELANLTKR